MVRVNHKNLSGTFGILGEFPLQYVSQEPSAFPLLDVSQVCSKHVFIARTFSGTFGMFPIQNISQDVRDVFSRWISTEGAFLSGRNNKHIFTEGTHQEIRNFSQGTQQP